MNVFERNWLFTRNGGEHFEEESSDDRSWESVDLPHDWAIAGPFSEDNDPEIVIVDPTRNIRTTYSHPGRTGGLPHVGAGCYRKHFSLYCKH